MPKIVIEATTEEIAAILRQLLEPTPVTAGGIRPSTTGIFPGTSVGGGFTMGPSNPPISISGSGASAKGVIGSSASSVMGASSGEAPMVSTLQTVVQSISEQITIKDFTRDVTEAEADLIIRYSAFSEKQRKLLKVLHQSGKPVTIDAVAKKMKCQRNNVLATKGNLVKRAALALKTNSPPVFIQTPDGKNTMELTPNFLSALDKLPVNIGSDW